MNIKVNRLLMAPCFVIDNFWGYYDNWVQDDILNSVGVNVTLKVAGFHNGLENEIYEYGY